MYISVVPEQPPFPAWNPMCRHTRHAHARSRMRVSRLHIIIPHGYSGSNPKLCLQLDYRIRDLLLSSDFLLPSFSSLPPYVFLAWFPPLSSRHRSAFSIVPSLSFYLVATIPNYMRLVARVYYVFDGAGDESLWIRIMPHGEPKLTKSWIQYIHTHIM